MPCSRFHRETAGVGVLKCHYSATALQSVLHCNLRSIGLLSIYMGFKPSCGLLHKGLAQAGTHDTRKPAGNGPD